jgi:hypothetical protein
MIDHAKEMLIGFTEAAKRLPKSPAGRAVHAKTVARWALHGYRGVKLDSLVMGGRRVTSVEACQRFFEQLTRLDNPRTTPTPSRVAQTRQRLKEAGLL